MNTPHKELLVKGRIVLLDEDVYETALRYSWGFSSGYVISNTLYLHHLVMGVPTGGLVVDHIDRNLLDNRRSNLRIVSQHINNLNRSAKNYVWRENRKKYQVRVMVHGRYECFGSYAEEADAIEAGKIAKAYVIKRALERGD